VRVRALFVVAAATLALTCAGAVARPASAGFRTDNPIVAENAKPGDNGWAAEQSPFRYVEGYTSEVSAAPGDSVHFHVQTTPAARYRIRVYRLGWYGGAGGRLVTCLPSCSTDVQGAPQPVPQYDQSTGLVRAGWPVTDTLQIGNDWVSGYYVAKLTLTSGSAAGQGSTVPLIVRDSARRASTILVQAPVATWQAYDSWGGRSLYSSFNGVGSNHVSFDRPYVHGEQDLFEWEYQLVRFLEGEGYDVSYTTSVDVDANPGELQRHRLFMTAGHDEYWTKGVRDALEAARDAGTNLAFMGGNTGYWQIRYEDGRRTVVEYRVRGNDPEPNPALKTTLFRLLTPPRPECQLLGVQWQSGIGLQADLPVVDGSLGDPWFRGTGFAGGSTVPRLIGGEWDGIEPNCPTPPLTVFFRFSASGDKGPADVTRYVAPSGARVFDASTLRFSWGLDNYGTGLPGVDTRLQQFMRNALDDLSRPASPAAVTAKQGKRGTYVHVVRQPDSRVRSMAVYRHPGAEPFSISDPTAVLVCASMRKRCIDRTKRLPTIVRYAAIVRDAWRASYPTLSDPVVR
jgi:hypothetical protein